MIADIVQRALIGVAISLAIGWLAVRKKSLSPSGALGAVVIGSIIFAFGNFAAGALLVAFFASSSALSHYKKNSSQKKRVAKLFDKTGRRDIGQVLANGAVAALSIVAAALLPHPLSSLSLAAFVGALATVNADTWATELGVLSKTPPRLITNLRPVTPGTSGAITFIGTVATIGGAVFIGSAWALFLFLQMALQSVVPPSASFLLGMLLQFVPMALIAGVAGSLSDSLMGATIQAHYFDAHDHALTERPHETDSHGNQTKNQRARGLRWLNNDWVNFLSSLAGALVAVAIQLALSA